MNVSDTVRAIASEIVGESLPIRIVTPDGTSIGPSNAPASLIVRNDDAIRHLVRAPGELGFARAYVSGSIDIEGDIFAVVALHRIVPDVRRHPAKVARLAHLVGPAAVWGPIDIPPEEVTIGPSWLSHSRQRDAASISHHYDVSNDFYSLILGPSWTYSCAVFETPQDSLEQAQWNKYELICRKLGLEAGMRLLDVGCGWGGMIMHAARHHGVRGVGITISENQYELARARVREAGLDGQVEIRKADYRDLDDREPFDAISSIGMVEHVGRDHLRPYFEILHSLLRVEGRLLNHQIGRTPERKPRSRIRSDRTRLHTRGFVHRYVFPDGELHELGDLIGVMQRSGFEVRHAESLREHYERTLRLWVTNLERNWDQAVDLTSEGRARVWRLYLAASAITFATNETQVHQVLAVRTDEGTGSSGLSAVRDRY